MAVTDIRTLIVIRSLFRRASPSPKRNSAGPTIHTAPDVCFSPLSCVHTEIPILGPRADSREAYYFPNDASESERMNEQHEIMKLVMDGRLHLSPFSRQHPPQKILDIGTGTGIWAIEMGDQFPEAQIIGTDLSPMQPNFVPPNVRFFVEDSYVPLSVC